MNNSFMNNIRGDMVILIVAFSQGRENNRKMFVEFVLTIIFIQLILFFCGYSGECIGFCDGEEQYTSY